MPEMNSESLQDVLQQFTGTPKGPEHPQEQIIRRLAAYMDPSILRELLQEEPKEVEAEEVVVLFADIRGFTRFAQQITSAQLITTLNDFLELTGACIHQNHGIIDKFMGDCIMAYWRMNDDPNIIRSACKAALDIQAQAKAFTASVLENTGAQIGIGIGIHAGPALLCRVGGREYRAYTIIGSTVNIACRLEEYAPPGDIYISEESADRFQDQILTEPTEQMLRRRMRDVSVRMKKLIGLVEVPVSN